MTEWESDYEDRNSHLFHAAPAYAVTKIKREGLRPRKGAGLFEHGSYAEHSQGKVFLADNFGAAKEWLWKVENMLEHHFDDPRRHVAVMLRVAPRMTRIDPVGNRDVDGSVYVTEIIPPKDIEFWDTRTGRWRLIKDFKRGAQGVPDTVREAHAKRNERADAEESRRRREAAREARELLRLEAKKRVSDLRKRWTVEEEERKKTHFRDSDEGKMILAKWKAKSQEERLDKARRIIEARRPFPGAPSPLALGEWGEVWREALGVDVEGNPVE